MKLATYNLKAEKLKDVEVKKAKEDHKVHQQLLKDYIVAYRQNQRQWSANTKGRSEINHSNKKPHKQKGTGRARQGTLAAPQFRGGGVVFGPKPKFDQHVRINQKEKRAVIRFLIEDKIQNEKVILIDKVEMNEPKTKTLSNFMQKCGLEKRTLFIGETVDSKSVAKKEHQQNFKKSLKNIPKVDFTMMNQVNGYQLLIAEHLVITEAGLKQFMETTKS